MTDTPYLTVIVPAYNEARRIGPTLASVTAYVATLPSAEVLVVDDASTDETAAMVQAHSAEHPEFRVIAVERNLGKGGAVRRGVEEARGRFVLFMDADSSTDVATFEGFRPALESGSEVVIGTRHAPGSVIGVPQPAHRRLMGRVFVWLASRMLGLRLTDITCGFKAFEREAARCLFSRQTLDGWAFDAELLFLAGRAGYRITEVPVTWVNEAGSKVNALREALVSFGSLIGIRWRHRGGVV